MGRIQLGKHAVPTHSTHPEDKPIRRHVEQVWLYKLAVLQALTHPANLKMANEDLWETTEPLLTESHQHQVELATARASQLENETQLHIHCHRATQLATAKAAARLEVTSIRIDLEIATAQISVLKADLVQPTERKTKAMREAKQLRADTTILKVQ